MDEKALVGSIIDLARVLGWKVARFPAVPVKYPGQPVRWTTPAQADGKGWLDLFMLRERPLVREIKAHETGTGGITVTREQQAWIDAHRIAGIDAGVWTLADYEDGLVEMQLTERRRIYPAL